MTENGQTDIRGDHVEDAPDALKELQQARSERDAYQQAAITAESNELTLHRQLSAYQQQELEQLRGEVQMWRRKAEEGARQALEEHEVAEEVSEPS